MRNILFFLSLSVAAVTPTYADEEIQLAAAIGMPTTTPSGGDGGADRPVEQGADTSSVGTVTHLSTQAMVAIGVGVAVVIGAASGGGSSSTTTH